MGVGKTRFRWARPGMVLLGRVPHHKTLDNEDDPRLQRLIPRWTGQFPTIVGPAVEQPGRTCGGQPSRRTADVCYNVIHLAGYLHVYTLPLHI